MSLFLASLNSGSNGNCYFVGTSTEGVIVDVGLSCRETEKRLLRLGINPKIIKAVFISHEHTDHIKGVEVFSKKHQIPVYITAATLQKSKMFIQEHLQRDFCDQQEIRIGALVITAFKKFHDAADPHSFMISGNGVNIAILTDLGHSCNNVKNIFKICHAAVLEANYDEKMLEDGPYPYYLKKRIQSNEGHLSNSQALELFSQHAPEYMSHLILAHLSRENNSPQLVQQIFSQQAVNTKVQVASRDYESELVLVTQTNEPSAINVEVDFELQIKLFS